MKFILRRTSDYHNKPHPKAEMMEFEGLHPTWGVEINSLEEMIEFLDGKDTNCSEIIITKSFWNEYPENRTIEIYDDHR